jgi:HTH-type transcriptional regulator / antitoxin HipB
MQIHPDLGNTCRDRRLALGLRQEDIATLAGCSVRFIHELEHNKPRLALDKVLDALEVLGLTLTTVALPTHA